MTRHRDYPSDSGQGVEGGTVYSGGAGIRVHMRDGTSRRFELDWNLFVPKEAETVEFLVVETDPSAPAMGLMPMKLTAKVCEKSCGHGRALVLVEINFERFKGLPIVRGCERPDAF